MVLEESEKRSFPAIKHNEYVSGDVQSLGFKLGNGQDATVGVIRGAGNWDFGEAHRREQITITSGGITALDPTDRFYRVGDVLTFEKGDKIRFKTSGPVSYLCIYSD